MAPAVSLLSAGDPVRALPRAAPALTATDLADAVSAAADLVGVSQAVVYLADYEQTLPLPVPGRQTPPRRELAVDRTFAGLAFRRGEVTSSPPPHAGGGADQERMCVPLMSGAERLGVLELVVPDPTGRLEAEARLLATLLSQLVLTLGAASDTYTQTRRCRTMSLAAEIQWDLLPPLTFADPRVVIAGALEPAYEIGGDTFDYAVIGDMIDLLVLDAILHGLGAALLASAAVGADRHGRRGQLDLPAIAGLIDQVIAGLID